MSILQYLERIKPASKCPHTANKDDSSDCEDDNGIVVVTGMYVCRSTKQCKKFNNMWRKGRESWLRYEKDIGMFYLLCVPEVR